MRYKGKVYRPPSEAYSLIVQVTYGCSHNSCAFCDMYDDKHFSMRPMQEIREDFELARRVYHRVERVFLADGDALMRKTDELIEILGLIYGLFPECERVTCYASPTSLQIKSEDDLRLLRARGLRMVYMGLESGCDAVLTRMNKGHDAAAIVAAGQKARRCGLALSVTAISGLGSRELLREHAIGTAQALSALPVQDLLVLAETYDVTFEAAQLYGTVSRDGYRSEDDVRAIAGGDAAVDPADCTQALTQYGGQLAYRVRFAATGGEYCYTIAARTGEILDVQRPTPPAQMPDLPAIPAGPDTPDDPTAPTDSEISISEALRRVLQELGISLPEIRDVDVQRVHVGGRDAYHITFTANGKPYSFYVDTHDGDIF